MLSKVLRVEVSCSVEHKKSSKISGTDRTSFPGLFLEYVLYSYP